jgi:RNA polymerase sigma-70 factor (ECF subfamily)
MSQPSEPQPGPGTPDAAFIREVQPALLAYARSLVRDTQTARDIVQDTFLRLFRNPPANGFAKAWLFRVCRTRAIDWWRSRHEFTVASTSDDTGQSDFFEHLPDESATLPGEALQNAEDTAEVFRHVEALPARQRELVRLKFQSGLSYKEIADTTGLTVTNVGFLLHTALQTLRSQMKGTR